MAKANINSSIDFKNLGDELTKTIASAFAAGSKKGLNSANFMQDLADQMEDFTKEQDAQKINDQVRILSMKTGLSLKKAELEIMAQEVVKENVLLGLGEQANIELYKTVEARKRQLTIQEDLEEQAEAAEKAAERLKDIDTERLELMEKINEKVSIAKLILTDQRALAAAGIATMIKGYESLSESFGEFRKEGLSVGQSLKETGTSIKAMFSLSGASMKENSELMAGMAETMGNMNGITADTVANVGSLAKTLGVAAGEAGKLQGQLQNMPGATAESATNTMEFAGALAMAAHVAPGAVMRDMAANAEDIALNTKNGGKDMAVVSVAAHKLGVEMSSLTKMSSALLDFESSINKQMEASVLLGKEINLDKAREAALNGDILGATQEMLKNVGGEAEFNKMNVLQRKALADSMGVSVSDLSKMVKNQDQLANLTEEQTQALQDGVPLGEVMAANAAGFAGKLKDGALGVAGVGATISEISGGFKDAKEMASGLFGSIKNGLAGMKDGGGIKGGLKSMLGTKTPELPGKTDSLGAGKTAGGGMTGLAEGLKSMAGSKVTQGILNLGLFGVMAIPAIASIPFLLFIGLTPLKQLGTNLMNLAIGLEFMGSGKVALGSLNLMLLGLAGSVGLIAIPFLSFMMLGGLIGAGLQGLSFGLQAMGNPAVALGVGILSVLVLSVGAGMLMLGVGIGVAAAGMSLLVASLKDVPFQNLMILPMAFMGIAAGLGLMAIAGLGAMPVIMSLVALAAVAPALVGLGAALGGMFGGGGSEKEDKMDTLIAKIDTLISVASKGGVINMDGKKVGEVIRLSINSSNVR